MSKGVRRFDMDTCLDAISKRRRRTIVDILAEDGPQDVGDLAAEVAAREEGMLTFDSAVFDDVRRGLEETHLPYLALYDVVVFDQEHDQVDPGPNFRQAKSARNAVALALGEELFADE